MLLQNLVEVATRKADKIPVIQKYILPVKEENDSWFLDNKDNVKIIVRDFGLGIEPQNIPMLTNRFYRVDSSRSRDLGSTGLGLSIVKHILNRHKAEFEIKSKFE